GPCENVGPFLRERGFSRPVGNSKLRRYCDTLACVGARIERILIFFDGGPVFRGIECILNENQGCYYLRLLGRVPISRAAITDTISPLNTKPRVVSATECSALRAVASMPGGR